MTTYDTASVPAARVLLAGPDTMHLSLDLEISDELRAELDSEKVVAQEADKINAVHCPEWLGAQVLPHGARGGYGLLLETENFSVKILGAGIPNRPGLFLELRSYFLHTHPDGPTGACEEALAWVREHLLADRDPVYVETWASFKAARLSRVDLHIDWQGGWTPSALDGDASSMHRFIKPARVKWQAFTDDDAVINAELSAEDLEHIGTLPRFFTHQTALWQHLTQHWLRLVVPDEQANRSRWPMDPSWELLHDQYGPLANAELLEEKSRLLVRGARYTGKSRLLCRMLLGVVNSLEVEDAAPASASLAALQFWIERIAAKEEARANARRKRYLKRYGAVPVWVERGMGARLARVEQVRHRIQMLLGIFSARGVLPLHLKPAHNVADLLLQHLDDLEAEAEEKGGLAKLLHDHFAKVYKVSAPRDFFTPIRLPAA